MACHKKDPKNSATPAKTVEEQHKAASKSPEAKKQ